MIMIIITDILVKFKMPGLLNKKLGSHFGSSAKSKRHIGRVITSMDSFSMEVPSFNIRGETRVGTLYGGIVTCLILSLTFAFALQRCFELVDPQQALINETKTENFFSNDEKFVLGDIDFAMAFSLHDSTTWEPLNDPRYI